jgi:RNA polymerase sigma factor (sigma-70 family)
MAGHPHGAPGALVRRAARGDEDAWRALVKRFTPMLRGVARGFRLSPADVDDLVQITWARAFHHIGRLQQPDAIAGWLAATARRECLRMLQRQTVEALTDHAALPERVEDRHPEAVVLEGERVRALRSAVRRLPRRQQRLLAAVLTMPDASYERLSKTLGMPIGSIGPTRLRSLHRLRSDRRLAEAVGA